MKKKLVKKVKKVVKSPEGSLSMRGMSFPVKASVITRSLLTISQKEGLTAESVIRNATNKDNVLHPCFEWNNAKAGHEYRLEQARSMIRCVVVKKKIGGKLKEVRAFVNIKRDEDGKLTTSPFVKGKSMYVTIDNAMRSVDLSRYTVERALLELEGFMDKYNNLRELRDLFSVIKKKIVTYRKKKKAA